MKKRTYGKLCDTESATLVGAKSFGEFGDPAGYEEQLFITRTKHYFIYGVGGAESKYAKPDITLITDEAAEEWQKDIKDM